ncbi:SMI1/KNR4 family protein [Nocardia sp. NPDC050193]
MTFITDLVGDLVQRGLVDRNDIRPCSEDEISALMAAQGVTDIPVSYREFMSYAGRNPYWLSRMGEWDYEWLIEAKQIAREIVVEDYGRDFAPYEDSFVFHTHQGYIFFYFRGEDLKEFDPKFWIYYGKRPVSVSEKTFNEWISELADYLPDELENRRRYGM